MKKTVSILLLALFLLQISTARINNGEYQFFLTIYEKYGLHNFSFSRPYNRKEIVNLLKEIKKKKNQLTTIEKKKLHALVEKYSDFMTTQNSEFHLYSYKNKKSNFHLDFVGRCGIENKFDTSIEKNLNTIIYTSGFKFFGNITDNFDYSFWFVDETSHGDTEKLKGTKTFTYKDEKNNSITKTIKTLDEYIKNRGLGWVNFAPEKNEIYFDRTDVFMNFYLPYLTLHLGKDTNIWGPATLSHLLLSDNATSYLEYTVKIDLGPFILTSMTAKLRTNEYDPNTKIILENSDEKYEFRKKYIAAHRAEFHIKNFIFALNEAVIYADKPFQFGYAIPFNFFWSEQHYEGDRDNMALGADFSYIPIKGIALYGEFFLDDLSTGKLSDYRHTKYAFTLGSRIYPTFLKDGRITVEYSRVNPIIYTHRFNVDNFTHYNSNIGSFLSPNSDYLFFAVEKDIASKLKGKLSFYTERHGDNYIDNTEHFQNVGGDIYYPDKLNDNSKPFPFSFLAGTKKTTKKIGLELSYLIEWKNFYKNLSINNLHLTCSVSYLDYEKSSPADAKLKENLSEKHTNFSFMLRYNY